MTGIITEHERLRREAEELGYARGLKDNALSLADPDYARIYTKTRVAAWSYGYACMLHGSGTRDLDLFLYPMGEASRAPQSSVTRGVRRRNQWVENDDAE